MEHGWFLQTVPDNISAPSSTAGKSIAAWIIDARSLDEGQTQLLTSWCADYTTVWFTVDQNKHKPKVPCVATLKAASVTSRYIIQNDLGFWCAIFGCRSYGNDRDLWRSVLGGLYGPRLRFRSSHTVWRRAGGRWMWLFYTTYLIHMHLNSAGSTGMNYSEGKNYVRAANRAPL